MKKTCFIYLIIVAFTWRTSETADTSAYCFQFTWLGPSYSTGSTVNITCDDYAGTPCIEPFVITTDSTPPNTTYMWANYNHSVIGCPLRSGYVCLKHSYSYNNAILNLTYFCGKMTEDKTKALTSGCYSQTLNSYTIEACACQTSFASDPCNSSTTYIGSFSAVSFFVLLSLFNSTNDLFNFLGLS